MENKFPHAGRDRGLRLTWAQSVVDEAFQIDPVHMEECAVKIFGGPAWAWTAESTTDEKVRAICRVAVGVRLRACSDSAVRTETREEWLRRCGFEEVTAEQRRENLARTLAILEIEKH